jgi:DNA-binding cell septation regulator SpoVG
LNKAFIEKEKIIMKKPENKTNETQECLKVTSFEVLRANYVAGKQGRNGFAFFDLELNGIKIYGMKVVEGKNGDFVAFPTREGNDKKYYSVCWARLSDDDQKKIIEAVEKALN